MTDGIWKNVQWTCRFCCRETRNIDCKQTMSCFADVFSSKTNKAINSIHLNSQLHHKKRTWSRYISPPENTLLPKNGIPGPVASPAPALWELIFVVSQGNFTDGNDHRNLRVPQDEPMNVGGILLDGRCEGWFDVYIYTYKYYEYHVYIHISHLTKESHKTPTTGIDSLRESLRFSDEQCICINLIQSMLVAVCWFFWLMYLTHNIYSL